MDTLDAIRSRRAVRGYDSQYVLSDSDRQELLELALLAPTAFNLQHVRLVDIQDPQLRAQIRAVAWDQAQVSEASMLWLSVPAWTAGNAMPAASGKAPRKTLHSSWSALSMAITATSRKYSATKPCAAAAWSHKR